MFWITCGLRLDETLDVLTENKLFIRQKLLFIIRSNC